MILQSIRLVNLKASQVKQFKRGAKRKKKEYDDRDSQWLTTFILANFCFYFPLMFPKQYERLHGAASTLKDKIKSRRRQIFQRNATKQAFASNDDNNDSGFASNHYKEMITALPPPPVYQHTPLEERVSSTAMSDPSPRRRLEHYHRIGYQHHPSHIIIYSNTLQLDRLLLEERRPFGWFQQVNDRTGVMHYSSQEGSHLSNLLPNLYFHQKPKQDQAALFMKCASLSGPPDEQQQQQHPLAAVIAFLSFSSMVLIFLS